MSRTVPSTPLAAEIRSRRAKARRSQFLRWTAILLALAVWEVVGLITPPIFLEPFHATIVSFFRLAASGELLTATLSSVWLLTVGLLISAVAGVVIGLLMGRYRTIRWALEPYVNGVYATPTIAFLPILMLWFGLYFAPKVAIVVLIAIFPVLKNVVAGVLSMGDEYLEPAVSMQAKEHQIFFRVILPATVPFIMAGLRLAIGRGVVGVVVGEFFTAQTGLGGLLVKFAGNFRTADMFVPIIILVTIGMVLTELVELLHKKIAPWKELERDQGR